MAIKHFQEISERFCVNNIKISKLFGKFEHNLELFKNNRISLLTGHNGIGKTTILKMIQAFCNGNIHNFRGFDFSTFEIEYTFKGKTVRSRIEKNSDTEIKQFHSLKENGNYLQEQEIKRSPFHRGQIKHLFNRLVKHGAILSRDLDAFTRRFAHLQRIGRSVFYDPQIKVQFDLDYPSTFLSWQKASFQEKEKLEAKTTHPIDINLPVKFMETERLRTTPDNTGRIGIFSHLDDDEDDEPLSIIKLFK